MLAWGGAGAEKTVVMRHVLALTCGGLKIGSNALEQRHIEEPKLAVLGDFPAVFREGGKALLLVSTRSERASERERKITLAGSGPSTSAYRDDRGTTNSVMPFSYTANQSLYANLAKVIAAVSIGVSSRLCVHGGYARARTWARPPSG